jgi:uncharacterized phage-associated protein
MERRPTFRESLKKIPKESITTLEEIELLLLSIIRRYNVDLELLQVQNILYYIHGFYYAFYQESLYVPNFLAGEHGVMQEDSNRRMRRYTIMYTQENPSVPLNQRFRIQRELIDESLTHTLEKKKYLTSCLSCRSKSTFQVRKWKKNVIRRILGETVITRIILFRFHQRMLTATSCQNLVHILLLSSASLTQYSFQVRHHGIRPSFSCDLSLSPTFCACTNIFLN